MSGGSMNYIFEQVNLASQLTHDAELSSLLLDISEVLKTEEWCRSGDIGIDEYLTMLTGFKKKWFFDPRAPRIEKIIDQRIEALREDLYMSFGIRKEGDDHEG